MKKFLLIAFMVLAGISTYAQYYVGGSVGVMRNFTDHETDFTIAPDFGYVYNDHWGMGLSLAYIYKNGHNSLSNGFAFNPYGRWTFAHLADDKLAFFLDGGFMFGFTKIKYMDTAVFYNIGFKPGIAYSFNEHWSVVSHLGFLGYEGADKRAESLGYKRKLGFDFSSMNLNFGLYYSF